MKTRQLLRSSKLDALGIANWLFVLSGAKLYLDWLLVTNPTSKNPLIRYIFRIGGYSASNPKGRFKQAIFLGSFHVVGCLIFLFFGKMWTVNNILINIYPIIVQLYIGFRCWRVVSFKN